MSINLKISLQFIFSSVIVSINIKDKRNNAIKKNLKVFPLKNYFKLFSTNIKSIKTLIVCRGRKTKIYTNIL